MAWRRLLRNTGEYLDRVRDPFHLAEERLLFAFASDADLGRWRTFQDSDHGGKSTLELQPSLDHPGTAEMSGHFCTDLRGSGEGVGEGEGVRRIRRSGFVGISSKEEEAERLRGLDEYDALVFRVLGDGRQYIANLRTDNWITGGASHDVWQAALFARKGGWQEVQVPWEAFTLTWRGRVVEQAHELHAGGITSVGVSLAGGTQLVNRAGRFRLGLDWVKAQRLQGVLQSD